MTKTRATIQYLRQCQAARTAGMLVSFTTDPAWMVNMAINRRAGWPDDPSTTRGSAMPVNGKYPKRAEGDLVRWLKNVARTINGTRIIIRPSEVPFQYRERLRNRITWPGEE